MLVLLWITFSKGPYTSWHTQSHHKTEEIVRFSGQYIGVDLTQYIVASGGVRVRRGASNFRGLCGLGGLAGSSPHLRRLHAPGLRSVIFWTFPQSSPSLSAARFMASPTPEYSTMAFQVPRGGSNPLSNFSSLLVPTPGSVLSQSRSVSSVCLSDRPFPSRNPTSRCQLRVLPGLPASWILIENGKLFLSALTRLLAMMGSLRHRSHANRQLSVPFTLQQTVSSLSPIGWSGTSDTWWSEVVATPPTYTPYISLASGSILPKGT